MHQPKYSLFYDFHITPQYPSVGEKFDAGRFAGRLKQCGADFVAFHARCNMGMAYYDTAIGIRHPGLKFDLFGELAKAFRDSGIALSAYFNVGLSREEGNRHRDWTTLHFGGQSYLEPRVSPYSMSMCYNSIYRDHLLAMIREVAERYPVAGFFFDCMSPFDCICPVCVREMKELGIDWNNPQEVIEFGRFSAARLADDISAELKKFSSEYLIYFNNGGEWESQAKSGTYLECECLPCRDGYEYLPVVSRFLRTLGKLTINMTGRFNRWGDFGSIRYESALRYELAYGLANGLRPNIGDHLHPDGSFNEAVLSLVEKLYHELLPCEPWFENMVSEAEIAVVYPKASTNIRYDAELRAATRMMEELNLQFNIVTLSSSWDQYDVLVFPDSVCFDAEISARVEKHLASGGKIIASGSSGLNSEGKFPERWGVRYDGKCKITPAYFSPFGLEMPDMPLAIYAEGCQVAAHSKSQVVSKLHRPLFNFGWDGIYPEYYNPPYQETELPFLTLTPQVAYFSHRIFTGYHLKAAEHIRCAFKYVVDILLPEPLLKLSGAPSYAHAFVTSKVGQTAIHLLAYIPEKRGTEAEIIEEDLLVNPFEISLRLDGRKAASVYTIPDRQPLQAVVSGKYLNIQVPSFQGCLRIGIDWQWN